MDNTRDGSQWDKNSTKKMFSCSHIIIHPAQWAGGTEGSLSGPFGLLLVASGWPIHILKKSAQKKRIASNSVKSQIN